MWTEDYLMSADSGESPRTLAVSRNQIDSSLIIVLENPRDPVCCIRISAFRNQQNHNILSALEAGTRLMVKASSGRRMGPFNSSTSASNLLATASAAVLAVFGPDRAVFVAMLTDLFSCLPFCPISPPPPFWQFPTAFLAKAKAHAPCRP
jgi:hypothetical protein